MLLFNLYTQAFSFWGFRVLGLCHTNDQAFALWGFIVQGILHTNDQTTMFKVNSAKSGVGILPHLFTSNL